jgi:predicted dehydrogenase
MIEAARAADRFVTVFHNRRLDPWFLSARDIIRDGLVGDLIEINIGIAYAPSLATWRGYKKASGGLMFDWGAHLVDYALHLDESPVRAVSGVLTPDPDAPPEANELHGTLRIYFESGVTANVTVSAADRHCPQRYKIIGTKGTLVDDWSHAPEGSMKVYGRLSGGETTETEVAYRKSRTQDLYDAIAARLRGAGELMVSGESSARVINVLCTAERSSEEGGAPLPLQPE